MPLMGYYKTK